MARDTNFYYSFLALPSAKRQAMIAVWDFCRAVDDAVDELAARNEDGAGPNAEELARSRAELARWRAELAACYEGGVPQSDQGRRLQPHVGRFNLPRVAFEDVMAGVEMDLERRRYATFDDLHDYCRHVASAVGLICLEIFGYRRDAARRYALDLGVALQLTNIVRDLAADLARGRLYLPLEDLERFGCPESALRHGVVTDRVAAVLRHQCERAREFYARARAALPREDARRLVAAEIMRAIYFAILRKIERSGYDVFARVTRIPRPARAAIALRTWTATMLGWRW